MDRYFYVLFITLFHTHYIAPGINELLNVLGSELTTREQLHLREEKKSILTKFNFIVFSLKRKHPVTDIGKPYTCLQIY